MVTKKYFALLGLCIGLQACSNQSAQVATSHTLSTKNVATADTPLPAETNPPGDIPDTQAFVKYTEPTLRVTVVYPEGWQRTVQRGGVTFARDFNGEQLRTGPATAGSLVVRDLRESAVKLPGGKATLVRFTSNSSQNAVTAKRVRLENNAYVFTTPHGDIVLHLWAPLGADNVDQWKHIAQSVRLH